MQGSQLLLDSQSMYIPPPPPPSRKDDKNAYPSYRRTQQLERTLGIMDNHKLVRKTHGSEKKQVINSVKRIIYAKHTMLTFFFKCIYRWMSCYPIENSFAYRGGKRINMADTLSKRLQSYLKCLNSFSHGECVMYCSHKSKLVFQDLREHYNVIVRKWQKHISPVSGPG